MTFTRGHDNRIACIEIMRAAAFHLHAYAAFDDEEPLRTRMPVPVRSCTVGECHSIHADRNVGFVMGQALNRRAADERCRIDRTDRRVTRSKDAHGTLGLLHLETVDLHFGHVVHTEADNAIGWSLEVCLRHRVHDGAVDDIGDCVA